MPRSHSTIMDNQDDNPYRESGPADAGSPTPSNPTNGRNDDGEGERNVERNVERNGESGGDDAGGPQTYSAGSDDPGAIADRGGSTNAPRRDRGDRGDRGDRFGGNGRRHRRHRGRGRRGGSGAGGDRQGGGGGGGSDRGWTGDRAGGQAGTSDAPPGQQGGGQPRQHEPIVLTPVGDTQGWFDTSRDGGFIRRAVASYLAEPGDAWMPPQMVRQLGIRKGDRVHALIGKDQ